MVFPLENWTKVVMELNDNAINRHKNVHAGTTVHPTSVEYFRAIQNRNWPGSHCRDNRDFTGYLRSRSESFKQILSQKSVLIITTRNHEDREQITILSTHFNSPSAFATASSFKR